MKTAKYIVILTCVAIILAIVFLFNTVFVLSKIDVNVQGGAGYTAEQIYSAGKIKTGANIFKINVDTVKNNIETEYSGVKVTKIERIFPNKITINVVQRVAVLVFEVDIGGETHTIATDRDFQMNIVSGKALSEYEGYTYVSGLVINRGNENGFELDVLKRLRKALIGFEKAGINSSAFRAFIQEIRISPESFLFITRSAGKGGGGARLSLPQESEDFNAAVFDIYSRYLALSPEDRGSPSVSVG